MAKKRTFIIAPGGLDTTDTIHIVAQTKSRRALLDVYAEDRYTEVEAFPNLPDAVKKAKRLGSKRPTII